MCVVFYILFYIWCMCISVTCVSCPWKPEDSIRSLVTGVTRWVLGLEPGPSSIVIVKPDYFTSHLSYVCCLC